MSKYNFYFNLGRSTYNARINGFVNPDGYLLSVHRYTPQRIKFCLELGLEFDELIFADNGFFKHINLLKKEFNNLSTPLLKQITDIERSLDHSIYPNEVPTELREKYRILINNIKNKLSSIEKEIIPENTVSEQNKINPKRLICREDILLASLIGLSIEPEYVKKYSSFYTYRNKRSARFYNNTISKKYGKYFGKPYGVISAVDYDSAFNAGKEMAKNNVRNLALGVGASMADNNWTDYYIKQKKIVELPRKVPRRSLRTPLIVKGICDGYYSWNKKYPSKFHFLGLGSQIMILICSLIMHKTREVSFDATSPIKDGFMGLIYFNKPAEKKVSARTLSLMFCKNPDSEWGCNCKYCKHYLPNYPFDYEQAVEWYEQNDRPKKILAKHLKGNIGLPESLPMFSEPDKGQRRTDIRDWRMGHNHIMIKNLVKEIEKNDKEMNLKTFTKNKVIEYADSTTAPHAYGASLGYSIAIGQF
ncbi:hypothetical protein C5F47_06020 [Nitrosopumilus cobalaminigenes]|uniref:Uncharacterized protein n=1 Tax=Nitrosopumilus cobalaminigenes TaxID=1470066 RepID=A0A7D5QXR7_9ARCH|nr:hypothetical protein [Nitrosopumilus cobalaminigenes]QLH03136.1 hypothetical protein C5F47_06020 [Nitrosopumilus cobalaminigenes]